MYEHRHQAPVSRRHFARRVVRHALYAFLFLVASSVLGTAGFHYFVGQSWLDGFLNAAMLLGGMGPIGDFTRASVTGKWFAALFALYAGLAFITAAGIILAPVLHRVMHRFHWEGE